MIANATVRTSALPDLLSVLYKNTVDYNWYNRFHWLDFVVGIEMGRSQVQSHSLVVGRQDWNHYTRNKSVNQSIRPSVQHLIFPSFFTLGKIS